MTNTKKINLYTKTKTQTQWTVYAIQCEPIEAFESAKNLTEAGWEVKLENEKNM